MNLRKLHQSLFAAALALLVVSGVQSSAAQAYSNEAALKGLEHTYAYFDITAGDPKKLLLRMHLLQETVSGMQSEGVSLIAIAGIRGEASRYFTRDVHYVLEEDAAVKKDIQRLLQKLAEDGIRFELCSIAAKLLGIEFSDFMPEINIVNNGYISLIGYQNKGYAVIPMD